MLNRAGDRRNLPRAARRGENVEISGQNRVAGSHVKQPFARPARQRFHFADDDGVFAGGQMRDTDGEIFPVNFFAKCHRVVGDAIDGERRIVLAVRKLPTYAHLLSAGSTDFVDRKHGRRTKP